MGEMGKWQFNRRFIDIPIRKEEEEEEEISRAIILRLIGQMIKEIMTY